MTENIPSPLPENTPPPSFTATDGIADISAYENLDLTQLNAPTTEVKPTEVKLESFLVRVVFWSKVVAWLGIICLLISSLYGWTRHQTQSSWLMSLPMNTAGSPLCTWMNHGYDEILRKDTVFRDYLNAHDKKEFSELLENGHCIAPDTIAEWLKLQKNLASEELGKVYENIVPKKFLSTTLSSSPELSIIAQNSPEHRLHHEIVLELISDTSEKNSSSASRVFCHEIRFHELTAEAVCTAMTKSPNQPRAKAIDFIKALSSTQSLLVTYPDTLDMKIDQKTNTLTTEFTVQMTYIPSRYEADEIKKLTYDKR